MSRNDAWMKSVTGQRIIKEPSLLPFRPDPYDRFATTMKTFFPPPKAEWRPQTGVQWSAR